MQRDEQPAERVSKWHRSLFYAKYCKWGASWAMIIPAGVREALHLRPGDVLLMRLHEPYVTLRRGEPDHVIDLKTFSLEDYPPRWPTAGTNAHTRPDPERTAPGATEPDAGDDGPGSTE